MSTDLDDAVEDDVVVVFAARELDEVSACLGRVLVVHLPGWSQDVATKSTNCQQQQHEEGKRNFRLPVPRR